MYSVETVAKWAKDVIAKDGYGSDYRYRAYHDQCAYVDDDGASCIVGHMLLDNGVLTEEQLLREPNSSVGVLLEELDIADEFTPEAERFMRALQIRQDDENQYTWGEALDYARSRVQ